MERDADAAHAGQYRVAGLAACAAGDLSALQQWVEGGWRPSAAIDKNGSNGLMWAAGGGFLEVFTTGTAYKQGVGGAGRWLSSSIGSN